jgi:hypothetical protein
MTLNTLSLLAVVAPVLAVAVPVDIDQEQDLPYRPALVIQPQLGLVVLGDLVVVMAAILSFLPLHQLEAA